MSFSFLYNVVLENYSVQNSPLGGTGVYSQLKVYSISVHVGPSPKEREKEDRKAR